jgi:hypothetical protein
LKDSQGNAAVVVQPTIRAGGHLDGSGNVQIIIGLNVKECIEATSYDFSADVGLAIGFGLGGSVAYFEAPNGKKGIGISGGGGWGIGASGGKSVETVVIWKNWK